MAPDGSAPQSPRTVTTIDLSLPAEPASNPVPPPSPRAAAEENRLQLMKAIAGHWYLERFNKHEYYEFVAGGSRPDSAEPHVKMTWQVGAGPEKSKGAITMYFHSVNEQENSFILTYKSDSGEFTYFNHYTFNEDRTSITVQSLNSELRPEYSPHTIVHVDATTRSPLVE